MKIKYYILVFLIFSSLFYAQNNDIKIKDISVSGNQLMINEDIINFSGLSKDSYINAIEIQNAINRLWILNKFSDIQIDLEETNYGITNLIIKVEEFPIINEVYFKGSYFDFELFKFKIKK